MIDWQRVSDLRRDIGEDDFADVVDVFLEEVQEAMDRLRDPAVGTGDTSVLQRLAASVSIAGEDRQSDPDHQHV